MGRHDPQGRLRGRGLAAGCAHHLRRYLEHAGSLALRRLRRTRAQQSVHRGGGERDGRFVKAGGGLFIIADHGKSDRDGDGWDAPRAWNDVFDRAGDPFGIRFSADNVTDSPDDNVLDDPSSRVLHGAFGDVRATTYYNGSTMRLDPAKNPSVRALIWKRGVPRENQYVTFAITELGKGRVAAIGDSSPADDGTGSGKLQNGWDDPNGNNRALFLNATAWLAHRE